MLITLNHSASSYGLPVILDDDGKVMDYAEGMTLALKNLGWSREKLALKAGYNSKRSIEKFWQGFPPSAQLLNVLMVELNKKHNPEYYEL